MIKTRRGVGEWMKESGRDPIKTGQRSCGKGGAGANAVDHTHTHTSTHPLGVFENLSHDPCGLSGPLQLQLG